MQRMCSLFARAGLPLFLVVGLGDEVSAELIQSPGAVTPTWRSNHGHAAVHLSSVDANRHPADPPQHAVPVVEAGPSTANEVAVQPNSDGMRSQVAQPEA